MTGWAAETVAAVLLALCLVTVVLHPRGLNEAVVAVPAAVIVVATGIVSLHRAGRIVGDLGPTVAFLAAILVFGRLCADAGVFDYLAGRVGRASRGDSRRLLWMVVVAAALVTATLTLDAAVVLLTPVVLGTAAVLRLPPRPHAFACVELANAGSLLLPVSNLTNLLAVSASGLTFWRFTGLMLLPWLGVVVLQWLALRWFFRADLPSETGEAGPAADSAAEPMPRYALAVLALTVGGFVLTSALSVAPAWSALLGVVLLGGPALYRRAVSPTSLVRSAGLAFCAFVLALGVVVEGVTRHGLARGLTRLIPHGTGLAALLGLTLIAAVLANVVNNLPATLVLLPLATGGPAAVLAVLIGVNLGPNASYPGSLATLLWRRQLPGSLGAEARPFHLYGLRTVLPSLVLATVLLWVGVCVVGA